MPNPAFMPLLILFPCPQVDLIDQDTDLVSKTNYLVQLFDAIGLKLQITCEIMAKTQSRFKSTTGTQVQPSLPDANFKVGDRACIKSIHPLFPNVSCIITSLPSSEATIVELESGARERILLKYLQPIEQQHSSVELTNIKNVPIGTSGSQSKEELQPVVCEVLPSACSVLPMTNEQAKQAIEEINTNINRIRVLLVELELRQGYLILGFSNMSQLMNSSLFVKARSSLQKELLAGRIEKDYLNVPIGTLPENHFRPLSKIKPEYYKCAYDLALGRAGNRPVTEKDVSAVVSNMLLENKNAAKRGIVEQLKEKPLFLASNYCKEGEVFFLQCLTQQERKYNGCWAIAIEVENRFTVKAAMYRGVLEVKQENINRIDSEQTQAEIREIYQRLTQLMKRQLDPIDEAQIEILCRRPWFTPRQKQALSAMESVYQIKN